MKFTGQIKNTNVRLPVDLHKAVKVEALERGKTTEQAYQEALEEWLDPGAGPFSTLKGEHERVLLAAIKILTEAPDTDLGKMQLLQLPKLVKSRRT